MCAPSIVTDDWITKGCHIHVGDIELTIRPDHRGSVAFFPVFSATDSNLVKEAIKTARVMCLPDQHVRKRWIQRVTMAIAFMSGNQSALASLASGRMAELHFLRVALERWKQQ